MVADTAGSRSSVMSRLNSVMAMHATMPRITALPLRLYLGSAFLSEVRHKIGPGTWTGWLHWMPAHILRHVQHDTGLYRDLLASIVLPHGTLFAALVALGELGVAISLLLGLATRLGVAVGILLTVNYALLNGTSLLDVSNDRALLVGFIVVLLTAPGRVLGFDAYLARRWPRAPFW
jgi:uncharacterized membrane protein YphA (DoxX/SURF4 family)